jgi:HK97 family phage prohead protease
VKRTNKREYETAWDLNTFARFKPETRAMAENEKNDLYVEGVAAVFDRDTILFSSGGIDYKERISKTAFDEADMTDVILNYNHGGKVIARTRNGTLKLWMESDGLYVRALISGTEEGKRLYEEIKGGYVDRMSFAFSVRESSYDEETHTRTIIKVKKAYDVSAVDFPAYDATHISARRTFETYIAEREKKAEKEAAAKILCKILRTIIGEKIKEAAN